MGIIYCRVTPSSYLFTGISIKNADRILATLSDENAVVRVHSHARNFS